ncbi:MAG: DUF4440 domain-containing protein [Gammaproteobacteria bacterium]|nr:DUF4440 domain-containing protein [Gammaproteobacteria bacterium]
MGLIFTMAMNLTDPLAAETAFYAAFEQRDVRAMMAVWDVADDNIVCVHPMGPTLKGVAAITKSWRLVFANDEAMRFTPHIIHRYEHDGLSVHHLYEQIRFGKGFARASLVIATNTYRKTAAGWRMVMHHGSPGRRPVAPTRPPPPQAVH